MATCVAVTVAPGITGLLRIRDFTDERGGSRLRVRGPREQRNNDDTYRESPGVQPERAELGQGILQEGKAIRHIQNGVRTQETAISHFVRA